MVLDELIERHKINSEVQKDYHVLRFFSAFVAVSDGKVQDIKGPCLHYCPLVELLYKESGGLKNIGAGQIKDNIKSIVEDKIRQFGFFTPGRKFSEQEISVPFGASEMLMYAMRKEIIEVAVIVCDGAGSVVATRPEIVQGIGARMNGLFFTTPIKEVTEKLKKAGCQVVFQDAAIDQIKAVEKACQLGYKNIAVTMNGYVEQDSLSQIKRLEKEFNTAITTLVVCTTGASPERIEEIGTYGDVVWACASKEVREQIGPKAILQISQRIPVFVLTAKGLEFVAGYADQNKAIANLNKEKQYILSRSLRGEKCRMGLYDMYLKEEELPVRSKKEPR